MHLQQQEAVDRAFYKTGGTLRHDAPSYVERAADRELFVGLLQGEFCYVLTSRQMGKSSLMVRTARKLGAQGVSVVVLDLTAVGQNLAPEQWYHGLLVRAGRQLQVEDQLEQFWDDRPKLSPVQRFFSAIRDVLLTTCPKPIVIFIDEIDVVRSLSFNTDEFFAAIRECYNRRTEDKQFDSLSFCLLGVATPSDLIRDTRITPFNIGKRIELNDFTPEEAAPLAIGLQLFTGRSEQLLGRVVYWTDGHPYLTQRLCHTLAAEMRPQSGVPNAVVDNCCENLFFSSRAREIDDNLVFVRERLRSEMDRVGLLQLYGEVLRDKTIPDDETDRLVSVLKLAGVVRSREGALQPRNRIYKRVFNREWIRSHMPGAELRRERAAFRLGVLRTAGIAVAVIAVLAFLVMYARDAEQRATARAEGESLARAELEQMRVRLSAAESAEDERRAKADAEAYAKAQAEARLKAEASAKANTVTASANSMLITNLIPKAIAAAPTLIHITNGIGVELVMVSADLWVGKYEVTQAEYAKIMEKNPSENRGNPRLPVDSVTWEEAKQFCQKLTESEKAAGSLPIGFVYDLPTQGQWETFLGDATFERAVTSQGSSRISTELVGSYPSNNRGLHDVLGNVWEWCLDGPSSQEKALRGGAFNNLKTFRFKPLTVATVHKLPPDGKSLDVGFRCVMAKGQ